MCGCSSHRTVLGTCRHPAHPVSCADSSSWNDKLRSQILDRDTCIAVHRKCIKEIRQCNAMPTYWMRQAQHAHPSKPDGTCVRAFTFNRALYPWTPSTPRVSVLIVYPRKTSSGHKLRPTAEIIHLNAGKGLLLQL